MGFRGYVRHFWDAILMLLRRLPIRGLPFEQQQQQQELKSSFSMGFRGCVRHFWGAILMLLRPSLPWRFLIRALPFEQQQPPPAAAAAVTSSHQQPPAATSSSHQQQQQQESQQQQEEKVAKIIKSSFSIGFRGYVKHFWGAMLMLLRPSLPWCLPIRKLPFEQQQQQQQEEKVAKFIIFYGLQKLGYIALKCNVSLEAASALDRSSKSVCSALLS